MDNNVQQDVQQNGTQLELPMTLGDWIVTFIVMGIPCVGLVMTFVWGFGKGNTSRRNYCRAVLILAVVGMVVGAIFSASLMAVITSAVNSYGN